MERESFEDAAIARVMNEHFVPHQGRPRGAARPRRHLHAGRRQALTGHGGWPMTVFLTPDGEPFWGGTYFPPEPRPGMPSFRQVLDGVGRGVPGAARRGRAARPTQLSAALGSRAGRSAHGTRGEPGLGVLADAPSCCARQLDERARRLRRRARSSRRTPLLPFLLRMHRRLGSGEALRMARDARRDGRRRHPRPARRRVPPLRGRRDWLVPHFEKMLYDNALLARAYLQAHALTGASRVPARWPPRRSTTCAARCGSTTADSRPRRTPTPTATRA